MRSPQPIATYTIVTKPHNVFKPKFEPGKVNQIEQYYMKCCTTWDDAAAQALDLAVPLTTELADVQVDRLFTGNEVKHWTLHIADIPTAGKAQVLSQNFYESTMVHHHSKRAVPVRLEGPEPGSLGGTLAEEITVDELGSDMQIDGPEPHDGSAPATQNGPEHRDSFLQFLEDLGYDVINQYWLKGIRFFYGDIVIEIFKILVRNDTAESNDARIKLQALDASDAFQIKAYITFPRNASVDLVNKGTKDLVDLKATLHNLFDLEVPDRMSMDARVARAN